MKMLKSETLPFFEFFYICNLLVPILAAPQWSMESWQTFSNSKVRKKFWII